MSIPYVARGRRVGRGDVSGSGRSRRSRLGRSAVALAVIASSLSLGATASASTTISGIGSFSYEEGSGPVLVAPNAVVTSGGSFADGHVEFAVAGATADETLSLLSSTAPDPTLNAISIVGAAVYLGLGGTDYKQVGTVDSIKDGTAGKPLRVNFSAVLPNADFAGAVTGNADARTPQGWTVNRQRVVLGSEASKTQGRSLPAATGSGSNFTVNGPAYTFTTDLNYGANGEKAGWAWEGKERAMESNGNYFSDVVAHAGHDTALRIWSSTAICATASVSEYCSSFGPDALSTEFSAKQNDSLAFDWSAAQGEDHYEVYGFIIRTDVTPNQSYELMYGRGGAKGWTTSSGTIPADGTYRFRFVSGSYDASGGRYTGASLYIDNVRVLSNDTNAAVVQGIVRKVQYENTSKNPSNTRTVSVDIAQPGQPTSTVTAPVAVELVDDAPEFTAPTGVTFTNSFGDQTFTTSTGSVVAIDPEGDAITYGIDGGAPANETIGAVTYNVSRTGTYGTLYVESSTGRYAFVPNGAAIDAMTVTTNEPLTVTATANGKTTNAEFPVRISVPASVPNTPVITAATAGDGSAAVTFTAPTWLGGSAVNSYVFSASTDGGATWSTLSHPLVATAGSVTLAGLTNGVDYLLRVEAVNATGTSDPSNSAAVRPLTVPSAPSIVSATPADRSIEVEWDASSVDGGTPITGYRIETSTDGGTTWSVAIANTGSTATTATVSGLTNGKNTAVRVSAINSVGAGAPSAPASATPRTVASAPRSVAVTPHDGRAVVSWLAPASDGGTPITGYVVRYSTDGGTTWTERTVTGTALSIDGLRNGTGVKVTVAAVNDAGRGPNSATVSTTPRTVPSGATITSVTPGNHTLTVTVGAPADNGGAAIEGYEYSIDGGVTWIPTGPLTDNSFNIRRLDNGVGITVMVRATNDAGSGAAATATGPVAPVIAPVLPVGLPKPAVPTGGAIVTVDGAERTATVTDVSTKAGSTAPKGTIEVKGGDVSVTMRSVHPSGEAVGLNGDGRPQIVAGGSTTVSGSGYKPGTTVDVWLLPEGRLIGTVTVGADGTFNESIAVPADIDLGDMVLQLNGVGDDGASRTLSVDAASVLGVTAQRDLGAKPASLAYTGGESSNTFGPVAIVFILLGAVLLMRRPKARSVR